MVARAATARVGFDAIRAFRNRTGLGNYSRSVLLGLREVAPELEMHLYAPSPPQPDFSTLPQELSATVHLPSTLLQLRGLRSLWRTFRLGRAAARDGIDLYHGLSHEMPRDLPRTGIRSVVTVPDLLYVSHPELFPAVDRQSYRWRYRWSAEHADAVVAISHWTREELHRLFAVPLNRIAVVPPTRDPRFAAIVPEAARAVVRGRYDLPDRFLISVGTLEPRKNQRLALRALAQLDPALPPLLLIGRDGGSEGDLRAEIGRLGLESRVMIRTGVSTDDLPVVMQSAALALYLSTAEGFGLPVVEAMSAGLPVIAARGPHLLDAGGSAALYVDANDPVAIAEAIEDLLHGRELAADYVAAGRRHAASFDAAPLAKRLLSVYDAVLTGTPLPVQSEPAPFAGAPSRTSETFP